MPKYRTTGDTQHLSITLDIHSEVTLTAKEITDALRYGLQDLMQDTGVMGGLKIEVRTQNIPTTSKG